ncbi:Pentatricopeptide repeat-containing protein [Nymphaea thermarum]|nr:Pentatricopeptide repeat-containing protein [Nymphaea thermarum]
MKCPGEEFRSLAEVSVWNAILRGCMEKGAHANGLSLYSKMRLHGVNPDHYTFSFVLKFCRPANGTPMSLTLCRETHGDIVGNLLKARELFESASIRDLVTWNSIIGAYAGHGQLKEALVLFKRMWDEHVKPDGFTLTTVLSVCARVGELDTGEWIREYIQRKGVALNYIVGAALVDMYSKCGRIKSAEEVFELSPKCDVSVWNAMIGGLAMHGRANNAFELFNQMLNVQIEPDAITFLSMLNACSHAGLVERGQTYFDTMRSEYLIVPQIEHYGAMVDLLGRAGRVDEAYNLIKSMNIQADAVIWRALLGACRIHGNVKLGEIATKQILKLEQRNSGDYVLLSNIYSSSSKWHDAENVWNAMKEKGIPKNPGLSWIKVNDVIHEFIAGDRTNPQSENIYRAVVEVMKQIKMVGFVPATNAVTYDVSEEEKEDFLYCHSEKLALAFGLLNTSPRSTIRIYKNLRICHDCHSVMKFVSRLYSREIVIRDRIRFHHFEGGTCSCKDYW